MFKRLVNEAQIEFAISPATPLLIKAGESGGIDPTRPEVEVVRTFKGQQLPFIPGASLKGAVRSHAERIIRTVGGKDRSRKPWSCDPLSSDSPCGRVKGPEQERYAGLCNACRIFGSTEFASHATMTDAVPEEPAAVYVEERSGVSIDRVLGSAVGAPTTYEVVAAGTFVGRIRLVNFSLDQLGLIALVLRDIDRRQVSLGSGKTRGLGQVSLVVRKVQIRYPGCELEKGIWCRATQKTFEKNEVLGAGVLFKEFSEYGYANGDLFAAEAEAGADEVGIGVIQEFAGGNVDSLWRGCVAAWKKNLKVPAKG